MSDNKQVVELAPVAERVKGKIHDLFFGVLSEEELNTMFNAEINSFINDTTHTFKIVDREVHNHETGWGSVREAIKTTTTTVTGLTPLQVIIWTAMQELVLDKFKAYYNKPELKAEVLKRWCPEESKDVEVSGVLGEKWEGVLREVAPIMAEHMFRKMFTEAVKAISENQEFEIQNVVMNMKNTGMLS